MLWFKLLLVEVLPLCLIAILNYAIVPLTSACSTCQREKV
jgi:hypothetical protein